jgi:ferredoxin
VRRGLRVVVDPVACQGRGLCAELFPERIEMDRFGFPVLSDEPFGPDLEEHARRAVAMCPHLALHLVVSEAPVASRRR